MPGGLPGVGFVVALLIGVTLVAVIPYLFVGDSAKRPEIAERPITLALPAGTSLADLQEARVDKVLDGDTMDVTIDGRGDRVRFYGIDTPEAGDRCYREATDRTRSIVGTRVLLLSDARDEDGNDRILRYVFLPDGTSVDATLVAEGFAEAWRQDGRYRDQIVALQEQAEQDKVGCLWNE
jgi:micrococcal nuclease